MEQPIIPPKKRKAATQTQIGKELKQIYANEESDEQIDITTISRAQVKRRWPWLIISALALFALAGITWAGLMRFGGQVRYGNDIDFRIEGPTAPRANENAIWTIHYKNKERLPLAKAKITIQLPTSLTVVSSEPQLPDDKSFTWQIGTLAPLESGSITVKARILDAIDSPIAVAAVLSYRPANFNADFDKVANWSSRIADSAIEAELIAPDESIPGDAETFTLNISRRNDLSNGINIPDLKVRFDPDQHIVVKTAKPAFSSADQKTWVTTSPSDKPLQFNVSGSFAANASGDVTLRAEVGTLNANGDFILLVPVSKVIKVIPGDLSLMIIRNGSTSDSVVNLGNSLHVSIDYQNQSQKTITDSEIALTISSVPVAGSTSPINWSTLSDLKNGKRAGNTITWTKKEAPELGSIAAGAKGSIDISIKTVDSVFTTTDRNYAIDLSARGLIGSLGGKPSNKAVSTPVLQTLVNTDASIGSAVTKVDGPLPPKVGEATTYRIVWVLANSLHEISGIKVSADLPKNISFASSGKIDAGDIHFDPTANTVTWTLNRLPTSVKSVSADFNVSLTPTADTAGKASAILGKTTLTATDTATNASLVTDTVALDTNSLPEDSAGAGIVQ